MSKRRLIVVGPIPPPVHGVTISTRLVLDNRKLREQFDVKHLDTSDHRDGQNIGRWDVTNLRIGLTNVFRLSTMLRRERGTVYIPLSQSSAAFLRDSIFIRLAAMYRWDVAIHLRGSEFMRLYRRSGRLFQSWARGSLRRVKSAAVMGETLRDAFGPLIAQDRIAVVPNGTPAVVAVGVERDPSQVLMLSNLRRRKGIIEAVETARIVLDRMEHARFVFAGRWEDTALKDEVFALCRGYADRVEFKPGVSGQEKDDLLSSSAVLLFVPREPEGHPRVVLEALAAGLPVVATDRGAIAETVEDGVSGFIHPEPDPETLAKSLCRLLENAGLYERMSSAARARYLDRYTQDHADQHLTDWLDTISLQPE